MVGGRDIGSVLLNGGGALGLAVVPSDVRSVLILGGRRGPDAPERSHNVCLLSASLAADVAWGSSGGWLEGGGDDSCCTVGRAEYSGVVKVCTGTGCVAVGGELDGGGGTGDEGFSGTNVRALGFNGTLKGNGAVSGRDVRGRGSFRTVFEGGRGGETSKFVTEGVGCTVGKNEGAVTGGGCGNAEERWSLPKSEKGDVPPNTELAAKGLDEETRTENAFFEGAVSGPCPRVIPNGEDVDAPKTDEVC